ncbi:DUF2975 domain-containing protein [uncultured Croceitalea sp.]|uniref:DUF2975 domain-containing protein n=1 Tax=uncultured Croceitalea sp. TaxID=1798908 RepID=UPI0033062110
MKTERKLKILIDLFFYGLVLAFLVDLIRSYFWYTEYKELINYQTIEKVSPISSTFIVLLIIFTFIIGLLFILGVHNLRKALLPIMEGNYFSQTVTSNFRKAGRIFFTLGSIIVLIKYVLPLISLVLTINNPALTKNTSHINLDPNTDSPFFLIIIGLFFILVSKLFIKSRELKKENDLTI